MIDIRLEARRDRVNAERLLKLDPCIRRRVEYFLKDSEGKGSYPVIAEAWRDPRAAFEVPARPEQSGLAFYCEVTADGHRPAALAADTVDIRWYWRMPEQQVRLYRMHIMSSAMGDG